MWNGLPEIPVNIFREGSEKEKRNNQTPPRGTFKGITLREYFKICDQAKPNETLRQIKEESLASSNSSLAQTPSFNLQDQKRAVRGKFKTETCQIDHENQLRGINFKSGQAEGVRKGNAQSLQKGQKGVYLPIKKKDQRKKVFTKIHSHSNKQQYYLANRSTLNSFYQIEENKRKMLKKIQQEKQRTNDLRLSDAFLITKYGSRFKIQAKAGKQE